MPLLSAVLLELVVLALLPRVVTVDGPAHLVGGYVLAHPRDAFLRHFYTIDLSPVPNLLTGALLAALLRLFGPDTAEKGLVAGYVVLMPAALRYALRGVDRRAGWLAVVAVPFTPHYLFTYGFYDLCLGVGLSLLVVGFALRRRSGWRARSTAGAALLLLLTWTAHLLPALIAGLVLGALAVARTRAAGRPLPVAARRHLLPVVLAGLPVALLTVRFALSPAAARGAASYSSPVGLVAELLSLTDPLVSYSRLEVLPAGLLALVLVGLAVVASRRRRQGPDRLALAASGLTVTAWYLLSPKQYGTEFGFLNDRLALFPPLLLLLWSATPPPRPAVRRAVVAAVLGASVTITVLRVPQERRYQDEVSELVSVTYAVPHASTLLGLQLWRDPPEHGHLRNHYRDALRHEVGRIAIVTHSIDVGHYEAITPYFPTRFRTGDDPRHAVDPTGQGLWSVPPRVEVRPDVVDVVIVLGRGRMSARQARLAAPALAQLQAGYRRTAVSVPTGLAEVWVRRTVPEAGTAPAAPGSSRRAGQGAP